MVYRGILALFLADQLTLSQPRGADYSLYPPNNNGTPGFSGHPTALLQMDGIEGIWFPGLGTYVGYPRHFKSNKYIIIIYQSWITETSDHRNLQKSLVGSGKYILLPTFPPLWTWAFYEFLKSWSCSIKFVFLNLFLSISVIMVTVTGF